MSNYDGKLRKAFEAIEAQYTYLITHPTPEQLVVFKDIVGSGRDYANMIHDMPNVWTGLASQAAIAGKLADPKFRFSEDHYHSRQRGGEEIVRLIIKCYQKKTKPKFSTVKKIIDKYCHVHYVTKEENNRLKHTMEPGKTWEQAYKECGVLLTDARELFGKRGRHSEVWKQEMHDKFKPFATKKYRRYRKTYAQVYD